MRPQLNSQTGYSLSATLISPSQCRKMTEITVYVEKKKKERKMHLPCHIAMKTNANNIFLILNISNLFPSPL